MRNGKRVFPETINDQKIKRTMGIKTVSHFSNRGHKLTVRLFIIVIL